MKPLNPGLQQKLPAPMKERGLPLSHVGGSKKVLIFVRKYILKDKNANIYPMKTLLICILLSVCTNAFAQDKSPDWTTDLIVYEIATKSFNSPDKPENGTFRSVKAKIPYLRKLGVNAIWLTGNSWSDDHHFYNIWTQYACMRPDSIDTSLGTRKEFRDLIGCAHKNGIRIFLDVITHGVMSDSPLITEHPDWFKGGSWGMTDYDWDGHHEDLDEWWVKTFTDYCLNDGVDGYRLDVAIFRPDLWKRIRQNCLSNGKEIVILLENREYSGDAIDFYQNNDNPIAAQTTKNEISKREIATDPGTYYSSNLNESNHYYLSVGLSCHDNGWDGFPEGQNPYVAKGSRAILGYNALLTPAIPIFMSGEEFNADYVPIPWHRSDLFGKKSSTGTWLYGSWIQWNQLKDKDKAAVLSDVTRMINIRKKYSDVICGYSTDDSTHIIKSITPIKGEISNPYILAIKGEKAILIAGNRKDCPQTISLRIPYEELGLESATIKDIWNKSSKKSQLPEDGIIEFEIGADHTPMGGLSVWLIEK